MSPRKPISPTPKEDAARLKALFEANTTLSQAEFGDRFNIGNQGAVWQYLNGRRPLNLKAARGFASGLGVKIEDFSPSIAEAIKDAETWTEDAGPGWPYKQLDEGKFRNLTETDASRLEGAILLAAAQLGLDVKKNA